MIVFKLQASFKKWQEFIIHAEKSDWTEDSASEEKNLEFKDLKLEFDQQLTIFYDFICEQKEKWLVKLCDIISTQIDELTNELFVEKASSGFGIIYYPDQDKKTDKLEESKDTVQQRTITFQADQISKRSPLKIIHFNDVYNIEESHNEPVAGYARFQSALRSYDNIKPLILFSGDIFAPSKLSIFFNGDHMIPFLKKAGIHCACVGNHDFDHGVDKLGELVNQWDFPWLLSNVKCSKTGGHLSNTVEEVVIEHEGYKIAIIGLAEIEWIETLLDIHYEDIIFEESIDCANRYVKKYKQDRDDIDFLIALTHMRTHRDELLARAVPELDLILGGHDHHTVNYEHHDTLLKKSGTDFREFTIINLSLLENTKSEYTDLKNIVKENNTHDLSSGVLVKDITKISKKYKTMITEFEKIEITSEFPRDPELHNVVLELSHKLEDKMKGICAYAGVDIIGLFTKIRHEETNFANMMTDMVNEANKTDITLINCGTYRKDHDMPPGPFRTGDLMDFLPMIDSICIMKVRGDKLHRLLENGVSAWPHFEGRFPSISGVKFAFDPSKPSGERIDAQDIKIKGEPIDYERFYTVSTKAFIASGKDGYVDFKSWETLVKEDEGLVLSDLFIKNWKMLQEQPDTDEFRTLLKIVGNEEWELSPPVEVDGKEVRFALMKPKVDGRLINKSV